MKKLLFLFAILFSTTVFAQTQLTGCMGISFGDSKETVKSVIKSKDSFEFYRETPTSISYLNGAFAGHKCVGAVCHFYDNQVHTIIILLENDQDPKIMSFYYEIIGELQSRYLIDPEKSHIFRKPYYEGDGYTSTAIKLGYADVASVFTFSDGNVISVSITESLSVKVVYQHTSLAGTAIDSNNKERVKDY